MSKKSWWKRQEVQEFIKILVFCKKHMERNASNREKFGFCIKKLNGNGKKDCKILKEIGVSYEKNAEWKCQEAHKILQKMGIT